jgi:ankyrin repeat protein
MEGFEGCLGEDDKRFFKLFEESTFEGSRAAARKMKKIAKRQTKNNQKCLLFHSLYVLSRSDNKKLSWPNSPLIVLLEFVDPNVMDGNEVASATYLHFLADPFDYSTHENQIVLAKQLSGHGAGVNAESTPHGETPLQSACFTRNVTNLDFVEVLLEAGADPNAQDHDGMTPLVWIIKAAPGAAKFLLNWPTVDANIVARSGYSFQAGVLLSAMSLCDKVALPDKPDQVQDQFLLRQWHEIEEMLVERGATDTGITTLE